MPSFASYCSGRWGEEGIWEELGGSEGERAGVVFYYMSSYWRSPTETSYTSCTSCGSLVNKPPPPTSSPPTPLAAPRRRWFIYNRERGLPVIPQSVRTSPTLWYS